MKYAIKWFALLFKYKKSLDPKRVSLKNSVGKHVHLGSGIKLDKSVIGDYTWINQDCRLLSVDCGRYVSIGPRVIIGENEHELYWLGTSEYLYNDTILRRIRMSNSAKTNIADGVWIGAGAIIKKGVQIGVGAVIGAGAVVTKDVPPYGIAVGVPAKVIKYRFNNSVVSALQSVDWLALSPEEIKAAIKDLPITIEIDLTSSLAFADRAGKILDHRHESLDKSSTSKPK